MSDDVATVRAAAAAFPSIGAVSSVRVLGLGHIHASWLVSGAARRFVVQRCNTAVFSDLEAVMANMATVLAVLDSPLHLVATAEGRTLWRYADGTVWRAFPYLEDTVSAAPVTTEDEAAELGRAFGLFHRALAVLDPDRLHVTLPHFHDPPARLDALDRAAEADTAGRRQRVASELAGLDALRYLSASAARVSDPAVPRRVAHFDAKADNVLLDRDSRRIRAIVDLDTVMPGSILWDVGDLARSACGPAAEDETALATIGFDLGRWRALVEGYLSCTGPLLTQGERRVLALAPLVVTFEQAVRFLTDYLDGDRYYRVARPDHNLERARCQLALLRSMVGQQSTMISAS